MPGRDPSWRITADGKVYRKGRKNYPNRDSYDGEFLDGLRHGRGMMKYHNADMYNGEFERDLFHGFGVYQWAPYEDDDGSPIIGKRYEGDFQDGKRHGQGVFLMGDGNYYNGGFEKDLFHNVGTLRHKNGNIFTGEWARGKAHGKMDINFENGDSYSGEMQTGKFHGKGKYVWSNDQGFYDGQWERGLKHGKGVRLFNNGNKYIGNFKNSEMDGDGIMLYANGDQYVGSWSHGHPQGQGVIKYAHGESYEGGFLHGFIFGSGKYSYIDGGYYEGEFKKMKVNKANGLEFPYPDGKRNGLGIRVWSNGTRYEGEWVDDKMSGNGTYTGVTGCQYLGTFWNGSKHGIGREEFGNVMGIKYVCPFGHRHQGTGYCCYDGDWERGYFHGSGEFTCSDGRKYVGEFYNGKRHGYGVQEYLKEGEAGDPDRLYIGGVGSLYRFKRYEGEWLEGWKEGHGKLYYVNGDLLEGNFHKGHPHGLIKHNFAYGTMKTRACIYERGIRKEWCPEIQKSTDAFAYLRSSTAAKNKKKPVSTADSDDKSNQPTQEVQ